MQRTMKFPKLRWEITLVILIKLIAIYLLWIVCFSHPVSHTLTSQSLGVRWLSTDRLIKKEVK